MNKLNNRKTIARASAKSPAKVSAPAKASNVVAISPAALTAVSAAAFGEARAYGSAIAAIAAAGGHQEPVKLAFQAGHVAASLYPGKWAANMIGKASAVLALPGSGSKADNRRTDIQERACAAARKAWSRHIAREGVATTETRGGKAKGAAKVGKDGKGGKASNVVQAADKFTPKAKTAAECATHLNAIAAGLSTYSGRNAAMLSTDAAAAIVEARKLILKAAASMEAKAAE